jgi:hypothetical protein
MAVSVDVTVFGDVTHYISVELPRRPGGLWCACLQDISHRDIQLGLIPEDNYFHRISTLKKLVCKCNK